MYLGVPWLQTNPQPTPAGWEDVSTRWWTPTRLHYITSQMTIFTYRKQKFEEILQSAQFNLVFICTCLVANKKFIKCGNM